MILLMRCWLVVFLIPSIAAAEWKVTERQESKAGSAQAFVITVSNSSVQAKIHAVTDGSSEVRFRVVNNADRRFSNVSFCDSGRQLGYRDLPDRYSGVVIRNPYDN